MEDGLTISLYVLDDLRGLEAGLGRFSTENLDDFLIRGSFLFQLLCRGERADYRLVPLGSVVFLSTQYALLRSLSLSNSRPGCNPLLENASGLLHTLGELPKKRQEGNVGKHGVVGDSILYNFRCEVANCVLHL